MSKEKFDRSKLTTIKLFLGHRLFSFRYMIRQGNPARFVKIVVVGVGFEPTYATRADLQSAAFNHSATPPTIFEPCVAIQW